MFTGGLVKKILESKKEFEGGNQQTPAPQKKVEIVSLLTDHNIDQE